MRQFARQCRIRAARAPMTVHASIDGDAARSDSGNRLSRAEWACSRTPEPTCASCMASALAECGDSRGHSSTRCSCLSGAAHDCAVSRVPLPVTSWDEAPCLPHTAARSVRFIHMPQTNQQGAVPPMGYPLSSMIRRRHAKRQIRRPSLECSATIMDFMGPHFRGLGACTSNPACLR